MGDGPESDRATLHTNPRTTCMIKLSWLLCFAKDAICNGHIGKTIAPGGVAHGSFAAIERHRHALRRPRPAQRVFVNETLHFADQRHLPGDKLVQVPARDRAAPLQHLGHSEEYAPLVEPT